MYAQTAKALSTLSQKSETVAEKCDCRRKRRDNGENSDCRRKVRQSYFSATVTIFGDKLSHFLRLCGQALINR